METPATTYPKPAASYNTPEEAQAALQAILDYIHTAPVDDDGNPVLAVNQEVLIIDIKLCLMEIERLMK